MQAPAAFLAGTWEQQPAVFRATPERRAFFEGLASFSELTRVARICEEEGEPLEFGERSGGDPGDTTPGRGLAAACGVHEGLAAGQRGYLPRGRRLQPLGMACRKQAVCPTTAAPAVTKSV